jgi:hypothetical protein
MSQQEFDYSELPYEAQRSELVYDEQRGSLLGEVPFGEWSDTLCAYHLLGEKLVPGRSRRLVFWNLIVLFALTVPVIWENVP